MEWTKSNQREEKYSNSYKISTIETDKISRFGKEWDKNEIICTLKILLLSMLLNMQFINKHIHFLEIHQ